MMIESENQEIDIQVRDFHVTLMRAETYRHEKPMMIVSDPPYNNNTTYGYYKDNLNKSDFIKLLKNYVHHSWNILRDSEYIITVINDVWQARLSCILEDKGFILRNHCIWHYTFGQNQRNKFTPSKQHILVYAKPNKSYYFDWTQASQYSWRHLNRDKRSVNPKKVMDDVWTDIPRLVHNSKEWLYYSNQLPKKLCERIILPFAHTETIIVDPFCGTGTFMKVACERGYDVIGGDINREAVELTLQRLSNLDEDIHDLLLKMRENEKTR